MDLLTASSPGGLPTLSLTTNSSWLPWAEVGGVAMPLISSLMAVPQLPYSYQVQISDTTCPESAAPAITHIHIHTYTQPYWVSATHFLSGLQLTTGHRLSSPHLITSASHSQSQLFANCPPNITQLQPQYFKTKPLRPTVPVEIIIIIIITTTIFIVLSS